MNKPARLIIIILSAALFKSGCVYAQDIHFSQTEMTHLLLNPAQAGAESKMRGILNHRNQWSSVASAYVTSALSWDMEIPNKNKSKKGFSAVGITIFHDKAGDAQMNTFQGNISYAYHVYLTEKSTLGAGFYGGFAQHSIDFSALQWTSQYDGTSFNSLLPSGETEASNSFSRIDAGAGVHYEYGKGERYMTANDQMRYQAGISFFHVNRPKNSFFGSDEKLEMKITGYTSALIGIGNSNFSVGPGIVYFRQGKMSELILGSKFRYSLKDESKYTGFEHAKAISLGAHFRNKDAVIASVFFETGKFSIGVSYDINVSALKTASGGKGGYEISLRFLNPNPFGGSKSEPRI